MKQDLQTRTSIMTFQAIMMNGQKTGDIPDDLDKTYLEHHFTPLDEKYGCHTYARQIFMPKNMVLVGKLHKKAHLTFVLKGTVDVVSEAGGKQRITAPSTFVSPAGVKRVFYALEDTLLTTVHLTENMGEENLGKIEDEVISPTYTDMGLEEPDLEGLNKFLSQK